MVEEPTSPVIAERPRGRLLAGALLGSLAVVAALLASASVGAGGPGPTIDRSVLLDAGRNATPAEDVQFDGPAFSLEVCINGAPHLWEGQLPPELVFGEDFDDLDLLEAVPDGSCDGPGVGFAERRPPPGLFDLAPDFEAFEACLADQGVDPDAKPDRNRRRVVVVGPEGRTEVEFGDDVGSVTVTGTEDAVEVTTEGGATVVDVEARERARRAALDACKGDLPGHGKPGLMFGFDLGFGGPFGEAPHGQFEEFFDDLFEEFEVEVESFGLDAGELRRERRADARRDLLSGVADDGGRCEPSASV